MKTIYGTFSEEQMEQYKKQLHSKMFWMLLYKDPKTSEKYSEVNFDKYFYNLMREIDGLNILLGYPSEIVGIMSMLEAAHKESLKENFDYSVYRKIVLDAHNLVDKINRG